MAKMGSACVYIRIIQHSARYIYIYICIDRERERKSICTIYIYVHTCVIFL